MCPQDDESQLLTMFMHNKYAAIVYEYYKVLSTRTCISDESLCVVYQFQTVLNRWSSVRMIDLYMSHRSWTTPVLRIVRLLEALTEKFSDSEVATRFLDENCTYPEMLGKDQCLFTHFSRLISTFLTMHKRYEGIYKNFKDTVTLLKSGRSDKCTYCTKQVSTRNIFIVIDPCQHVFCRDCYDYQLKSTMALFTPL